MKHSEIAKVVMTAVVTAVLLVPCQLFAQKSAAAAAAPPVANEVIHACYVPGSGTIYIIGAPGSPSDCHGKHVEFAWNALGPASVTTDKLADGAVTAQKLAVTPRLVVSGGESVYETINPGFHTYYMYCPTGQSAIGVSINRQGVNILNTVTSQPVQDGERSGWQYYFEYVGTYSSAIFTARVLCASIVMT